MAITEAELKKINDERRRKNLPRLTLSQAQQIVTAQATITPSFDITSFLIGFATGHGGFSMEGQLGAAMHPQENPSWPQEYGERVKGQDTTQQSSPAPQPDPTPAPAPEPSPSYSAPDPSPSFDSNGGNI